jgi:hypothetical protein
MLTRKDVAATGLTALVVLTFVATHESWNVPLVGDSYRLAAGAIAVLGIVTCGLGSPSVDAPSRVLMGLGALALVLSVLAVVIGSLTVLSLLVADVVLLWALSTIRHVLGSGSKGWPLRGSIA